jgi:hypothetical protein
VRLALPLGLADWGDLTASIRGGKTNQENGMGKKMDGAVEVPLAFSLPQRPTGPFVWDQIRARLDKVTADDVGECRELYDFLERMRQRLRLVHWRSLQLYVGPIPRCVKAVGGKGR